MKKEKTPLIIAIIVVIVLIIIALILEATILKKQKGEEFSEDVISLENVNIAQEIYGLTATIKRIKNKTLILEAMIPLDDESETPVKAKVMAVITDNTEITKLTFPEQSSIGPVDPLFPEELEATFEDLEVGKNIDIGSTENISENIKNETEFDSSYIFILE